MKTALTAVRASYTAAAFDGSTYYRFYVPFGRAADESVLAPLEQFGFTVEQGLSHQQLLERIRGWPHQLSRSCVDPSPATWVAGRLLRLL
jgi:hypothetical protein